MKRKVLSISIVLIVIILGCKPENNLQTGEGYINVMGGRIWYEINGYGNKIPIVMLHGGPGRGRSNPLESTYNHRILY